MRYLGGKAKTVHMIAPALARHAAPGVTYWEPFLGGAAVAARVVRSFDRAVLADAMPDLMDLWRAAVAGWEPPESVSESEYQALRVAEPSPLRTFAGFAASYGGKWWAGYVRPSARDRGGFSSSRGAFLRDASVLRTASSVELLTGDYRDTCHPRSGDVVYLDPPYADATGYKGTGPFDNDTLWKVAASWIDDGAHVYVSEFIAPVGWSTVVSRRHVDYLRRGTPRQDGLFTREPERDHMTITTDARAYGGDAPPRAGHRRVVGGDVRPAREPAGRARTNEREE